MTASTRKRFEVSVSPLRSENDLQLALARIDELLNDRPGSAAEAELEVLSELVRAYEQVHHPIGLPDGVRERPIS